MKKPLISSILIVLVLVIIFVFSRAKHGAIVPQEIAQGTATTSAATTAPIALAPSVPLEQTLKKQTWNIFQNYRTAAKNHDLPTLSGLSYQLSAVCKDPAQQVACFQKMDAVYTATKSLQQTDFDHIVYDSKQVILYTDWQTVYNSDVTIAGRVLVYFARTPNGTLKLLSFNPSQAEYIAHRDSSGKTLTQSVIDITVASTTAADDIALKKDSDGNGWWDSIQSLFY